MDEHSLRCFLTLCEEMNFGRAAERMNMTQPPFSRQIKMLEEKLGVVLFERSTRSVRLTVAGEILLPGIRTWVQTATELLSTAKQVALGELGVIRLGFTAGASYEFLPRMVELVRDHLPGVSLKLEERPTYDQIDAIQNRRLDIGIVRYPRSSQGLSLTRAYCEKLKIALPKTHPLAKTSGPVALGALHNENFLLYTPDSNEYLHAITSTLLASAGIIPANVQYIRSIHTILPLVALSIGIAIVPESAAKMTVENVCIKDIEHGPSSVTADLYLVHHPDISNPSALRLLSIWANHPSNVLRGGDVT